VNLLDHTAPWFAAFDPALLAQWQQPDWQQVFNHALQVHGVRNTAALALRLVPQTMLPPGEAYEAFILRTGQVPTRENAHDFFNALCWLHLPRAKAYLNALQAAEIARHGVHGKRGPLRDFCTLMDESALLMVAPQHLITALQQRDWHGLLVAQRMQWQQQVRVLPLGHALLEKLLNPYKAVTAQVFCIDVSEGSKRIIHELFQPFLPEKAHEYCALWDELLLNSLHSMISVKPAVLAPLPVLGIPGWWPANEEPGFYDDAQVFRPRALP
jgi:hypothetical protein